MVATIIGNAAYSIASEPSVLDTPQVTLGLHRQGLQLFTAPAGITGGVPTVSPDADVRRLLAEGRYDQAFEQLLATYVIVSQPQVQSLPDAAGVPPHIALIGLPVSLVGLAHLIVYWLRRDERR